MTQNEFEHTRFENDECTSRGLCSITPGAASMQELIRYFIVLSANYIVNLEMLNLYNEKIKLSVINIIAGLIYINECSEQQMYRLVLRCFYIFVSSKERYIAACREINISPTLQKEFISFNDDGNPASAISLGAQLMKIKAKAFSKPVKEYLELLFLVYKSICLNISYLTDFNICIKDYVSIILKSIYSLQNSTIDDIKAEILNISVLDTNIRCELVKEIFKNFGKISKVNVSYSTRKGKCILVSGNNLFDLQNILELTKDKKIDIYSHSNLLIAHSLEKFQKYENFCGHYVNINKNCVADYATFPGAILLTKNSKNDTQYLYRGKIFSHDYVTPQGVIKLEPSDYKPVIDYALKSKGFSKGQKRPDSELGFEISEFEDLLVNLQNAISKNKLKQIYVIGNNISFDAQKEYFNKFFKNLNSEEFIINFCDYDNIKLNSIVNINIGNYSPMISYLIKKYLINPKLADKIAFIFPDCSILTVSLILSLYAGNIKNIYISKCGARLINPLVFDTFLKKYNIRLISEPENDLKQMRQNNT